MLTKSSLLPLVGTEPGEAGVARTRHSASSAEAVTCSIMWPDSSPGWTARNGGSPSLKRGIQQPVGAALADAGERGQRDGEEVALERQVLAVEVAAGDHLARRTPADCRWPRSARWKRRGALRSGRRARRRAPGARSAASRRPARAGTWHGTRGSRCLRAAGAAGRAGLLGRDAGGPRGYARRRRAACRAAHRARARRRRRRPRRDPRARAAQRTQASIACVPFTSEMPSFACSSMGSMPARAQRFRAGQAPAVESASPSPISTSAMCASGARSPLAPTLPREGTSGVTPAFNRSQSRSAMTGRMPEKPLASTFARISIMPRTASTLSGSPTPQACERSRFSCSSARSSCGMRSSARVAEAGVDGVDRRFAPRPGVRPRRAIRACAPAHRARVQRERYRERRGGDIPDGERSR